MNSHRSTYAFTLIEVLLALTLTAVLLTIVSVTIGAVARDSQRLESMRAEPLWLDSVVAVLRRDLRQAETYRIKDGVLTLHGHAGKVDNHDPIQIEYEVLNLNDTFWLMRRVASDPTKPTGKPTVELLCGGVKAWSLTMQSEEAGGAARGQVLGESQTTPPLDPDALPPIPDQVRVSFTLVPPTTRQPPTRNAASYPGAPPHPDSRSNPNRLSREYLIVVR